MNRLPSDFDRPSVADRPARAVAVTETASTLRLSDQPEAPAIRALAPIAARDACALVAAVVDEMSRLVALPAASGHPSPCRTMAKAGCAMTRRTDVHKRQIAMYLAHTSLSLSLTAIGEIMGRDRTTVGHACSVVEDRRDDKAYDAFIASAERLVAAIFLRGGPHGA